MDSFIKKIFNGQSDEFVHVQFQKFSKGTFENRAMVKASKTAKGYSIATTAEYANELVRSVGSLIEDKTLVRGVVVSTRDLTGELEFKDKKQFMGVKQYIIDSEMSKEDILNLCDKFPSSFLGLSFAIDGTELKIKAKPPKSSKPSSKSDEAPKIDFCRLKTDNEELAKSLLFDVPPFKKAEITHDFIITGLDIPKDIEDPLEMREKTIRKGTIVRKMVVDGNKSQKESELSA